MTTVAAIRRPDVGSALAWVCGAVVLGCVSALAGLPAFYLLIGLSIIIIFAALLTKYSSQAMVASVLALGLCPFSLGIETGVLPKLFADEMLFVGYLIVLPILFWFTPRVWQRGASTYYCFLALFVVTESLSILVRTDLIAARNFLETAVFGPLLFIIFLQESANSDREEAIATAIVWLTATLAVLSVIERIVQRNPILEQMEQQGFLYLSPRIVAITEGVYRPYVTFFHPSETGTFMAMGLPFAIRAWRRSRHWSSALLIALIAAGVVVNATRGVWVGIALSLLVLAKNPLRILLYSVPTVSLVGLAGYLGLRSTPFMQRLSDVNNLLGRFIYWQLGFKVFADHMVLGVGHMQFQSFYLDYLQDLSELAQVDLKQVYVIDNIYLTTLVEHGLIGFVGMVSLFVITALTLRRLRIELQRHGLEREASFVQAGQLVLVIYTVAGFFADVNQFTKATKFLFVILGVSMGVAYRSLSRIESRSQSMDGVGRLAVENAR